VVIPTVSFANAILHVINAMETITLNSHVGEDGILHLDIPLTIDSECWVSLPQPNLLAFGRIRVRCTINI